VKIKDRQGWKIGQPCLGYPTWGDINLTKRRQLFEVDLCQLFVVVKIDFFEGGKFGELYLSQRLEIGARDDLKLSKCAQKNVLKIEFY
jgi:hypothetical protein